MGADGRRGRRAGPRLVTVVVLAGGTGGAKLARGMLDVVGDDLVVIANTGDDIEIYGAYVSPDPDLCAFWLADRIDERGWGLRDDTFQVMDGFRELGVEVWFNLGDRDLALGLRRAELMAGGARLTETLGELTLSLGLGARVLPMADAPVRTWVLARDRWAPFQEFMIRDRAAGPVDGVELRGVRGRGAAARGARGDLRARGRSWSAPPTPSSPSGRSSRCPGCARRCARARRRSWRCPRSSTARSSRARPRTSWPGRAAGERGRRRRAARGRARRHGERRAHRRRDCPCCRRTRSWRTRRDAAGSRTPR